SLDGFAAGPNDDVAFVPASMQGDRSFGQEQMSLMDECDTMLLGRVTYNMFSRYWPNVKQGDEQPFADQFNGLSKIVFSTTLDRAPWGSWPDARVVSRSPTAEVDDLKRRPGGRHFRVWQHLCGAGPHACELGGRVPTRPVPSDSRHRQKAVWRGAATSDDDA